MSAIGNRPQHTYLSVVLLTLCLAVMPVSIAVAAGGQVIYEGSHGLQEFSWQQDESGARYPVLEGARTLAEPGLARLPSREMLFLVPLASDVSRVWVEPLMTHREALAQDLAVAEAREISTGETLAISLMQDDGISFPASWSRSGGTHTWRGYRLLSVTVYPVRRVIENGVEVLEYLDEFAVHAEFTAAQGTGDIIQRQRAVSGEVQNNKGVLSALVANPEVLSSYQRENGQKVDLVGQPFQPASTPSINGSSVNYLIITNETLKSTFQILADFKTAMGIPTVVVTREVIAANNRNGADIQETIRHYIRDAYSLWGIENVLLGGDSDILPPRYINNSLYPTGGFTSIPCDLYFACLDGNWNADGDSSFGEPASTGVTGDLVDFAEEVYVGRAAVSTPEAALTFINKIISYETTAAGAAWPNRALFAAEVLFPEDFDPLETIFLDGAQFVDQQVNESIIPCTTMEYTRMYETDLGFPRDAELSRSALIDTLNTGRYGIFNQIGHGYYFNMSVGDANFMTTDADALTNGNALFVMFALNCASAVFDNSCLMERFVQNPNGGAICALGSVRAAFPNNSNNYQQNFFAELYCGTERRAGKLLAMSRLPYIGLTDINSVDRWTFENYTLLGDPTLPIWTGVPTTVAVGGTAGMNVGPQTLNYSVTSGGSPVAGALVCLRKDGEDQVSGITDAAGLVSLGFLPVSPGTAVLTVTGKNLSLSSVVLPVTAGTSYLAFNTMPFVDDGTLGSAGNGNSQIETGEMIALSPVFEETGGVGETGLTAVLTCDNPAVIIPVDNAALDDVSAGGFTAVQSPFVVQIPAVLVDGERLLFTMVITGAGGTYETRWETTVATHEAEVATLDWDDGVFGNGDGSLGDGERIAIMVNLKNFGNGLLDQVDAVLRTSSTNVVIFDSTATWTNLALLDEAGGDAVFSLSIGLVTKASDAWLLFTDNYGRTFRHDFSLPRPVAPLAIVTDTSLGADVIGLSWAPSISTDIFGYNVYRSQNPTGGFVRVNKDVVEGSAYYRDENLSLLTKYYYYVTSVVASRVPSLSSVIVGQATAPAEQIGFPVEFADETSSHLAVGDIDGDGDDEIVLASNQVYVWHHDGLELFDGDSESQTLGNLTDFEVGTILGPAAVTLANLDGQPGMEIIVCELNPNDLVHVIRADGTELPGWPKSTEALIGADWNWSAPAAGDIDGDGSPEVVVNTLNGVVWAWHADGTEVRDGDNDPATEGVFYVRPGATYEWARSGPALYDLDGDGAKDVIFGTKNDATGLRRLMAVKYDGTDVPGFPYVALGPINCDPAVGDLNNDGMVEIVFYDKFGYVYAVQQDGTAYPGFPRHTGVISTDEWVCSPGLGDIDGDGMLEIIYTPNETGLIGRIGVVDTDFVGGTSGDFLPGFPVVIPGSSEGSPIIGDIDGDGSPEILHGIGGGNESSPYNLYAYHADGSSVAGFPITLTGPLMAAVTITDIDRDMDVDIVYGGWDFKVHIWDMPYAYDRVNTPWPTFGGNPQRDGVLFPVHLVGVEDGDRVPAAGFTVMSPYPNPFNPSTAVRLYIPAGGELELAVYDVSGRKVRALHSGSIGTGWHTLIWDGQDDSGRGQASGMYFMRAKSMGETTIHKMTLVK